MNPDRLIGALGQPGRTRAGSGHYWMSLWRFLLERDWQGEEVFNPVLSSQSARTHLRGRKNRC